VKLAERMTLSGFLLFIMSFALAQEPTTISMWHIAVPGDSYAEVLPPSIEDFNEENNSFTIDAQAIQVDALFTQIPVAASADDLPDAFQTWGGGRLESLINANKVRAVTQLESDERFNPLTLRAATFDGERYAIPLSQSIIVLWLNADLFEEYGVARPDTWNDFIQACRAFNEQGIVPVALGNAAGWPGGHMISYIITRLGGTDAVQESLNRTASFDEEVYIEAGKRLQEAVEANCFQSGFNGTSDTDAQLLFATEVAAMRLSGDWDLVGLTQANPAIEKKIEIASFPTFEDAPGTASDLIGGPGQAFAVAANAPEGTEAALIELVTSDYFLNRLLEANLIPALTGYLDRIESPVKREIAQLLEDASFVQLYYDQYLPPALIEAHIDTTQELFGLSITPEEAAARMETVATDLIGAVKE